MLLICTNRNSKNLALYVLRFNGYFCILDINFSFSSFSRFQSIFAMYYVSTIVCSNVNNT